ncbi:MAG TPA: DUF4190 domain-containing protein [Pseudolysinimonas sp.]|nr:DUF4190 domain-containing protein [Pseudolysinimonas sp.]
MSDTTPPTPPVPPVPPPAPDAVVPPQPNPYAPPAAQPNPYAQPVPYAQPAPYGAAGYAYAPRTNTLAIVGFVLSFFVSVAGIICSHIALGQIKRTGEGGRGLALAGVIIGYVITGFWVLYFVVIIVVIAIAASQGYSNYSG